MTILIKRVFESSIAIPNGLYYTGDSNPRSDGPIIKLDRAYNGVLINFSLKYAPELGNGHYRVRAKILGADWKEVNEAFALLESAGNFEIKSISLPLLEEDLAR